ncbi:ABC transporter substrate-binding protein [Alloiococcus sp. CFN-8]|uniref:ABC transporter substrate-binding protein n=1 Tax=Alloiococcus sp. CFN-8 TaxID=3416081 RepID=UPI003CF5946A
MVFKKTIGLIAAAIMSISLVACGDGSEKGSSGTKVGSDGVIEVTLPTYMTGENVGAVFFEPHIERFNEKHKDKYRIVLEEVTQTNYAEKIKQMALQDMLPFLVHPPASGGIDIQWFEEVAVANDMVYDLSKWLNDTPAVKDLVIDESLDFVTRDGKVVIMPMVTVRPIGMFYNSELYTPEKPVGEMTVDEFVDSLGDNKIPFQSAENAWTSGLFLTALIANEEGGADFLKENSGKTLYDFTDPVIVSAVEKLKEVFDEKATSNSIGGGYADMANSFMSSSAAVMFNGPWMSGDFNEGSSDKWSNGFDGKNVKSDIYPGNIAIANTAFYGDLWIPSTVSEEELEVALAYLEFRYSPEEIEAYILAEGGIAPKLEYSASFNEKLQETQVLADLAEASQGEDVTYVQNLLEMMPSSVSDSEFAKLLPKLYDGTLSAEEFCSQLSDKAAEAK